MLPTLLIRDETICSLGKTDNTFTVYHSGKQLACKDHVSSRDFSTISQFVPLIGG
jgi:hypothetical protein